MLIASITINDLTLLLGALGVFLPILVQNYLLLKRQGVNAAASKVEKQEIKEAVQEVHVLVNSNQATRDTAMRAEGHAVGLLDERANPQEPKEGNHGK